MISGAKNVFDGLDFEMRKKSFLDKESVTLENEDFNNTWFCKSNNDVKLRMILTPYVQENVLKVINDLLFAFSKINNIFWVSLDLKNDDSTFEINLRNKITSENREVIVDDLVNDCINDINTFQTWLSYITVFRTLFETE